MTPRLEHLSAADPCPDGVPCRGPAAIARPEAELATLTPEERARYDADDFFRGVVDTVIAMEREHPGGFTRPAIIRETYGDDWEREIADLEAGRHPFFQLP